MKKFAKILLCLIFVVCSFSLVGCKKKDDFVYPSKTDVTVGNGGLAVSKGGYLYYVNGYLPADEMKKQHASYTLGALMIAKLDANGEIVKTSDGSLNDEYYRYMSHKLCGFEATNLYIFDNYLYFVSPCQENEQGHHGQWAKQLVEFYRIKLDKSGKVEHIYQSKADSRDKVQYAFFDDDKTSLIVLDDTTLYKINASSHSKVRISKNVNSVAFPENNDYENVFFTTNDEGTYKLYSLNAITGEKDEYGTTSTNSFTVEAVKGDYVFINSDDYYQRSNIKEKTTFADICSSTDLYDSIAITDDGSVLIGVTANSIKFHYEGSMQSTPAHDVVDADASSLTIVGFVNNEVVYVDDQNVVKKVSYRLVDSTEITTIAKLDDLFVDHYDLDGNYLYFFKTIGSNKYFHRLNVGNGEGREVEFVGVCLAEDLTETTED